MMKRILTTATLCLAFNFVAPQTGQSTQYDLTYAGAEVEINDAIFWEGSVHPAGTGVIESFVRIDGNHDVIEEGYNTDIRPVQFDEITDPNFTRSLLLSEVPIVTIEEIEYREFFLDINEPAATKFSLLSLDKLQIFLEDDDSLGYDEGTATGYPDIFGGVASAIYNMDVLGPPEVDNWIVLDYNLNSGGSGWADMFAYIPNSLFILDGVDDPNVYLYSQFGVQAPNNNNYEEWAVRTPAPIPEPATMLLFGTGLVGLAGVARRKSRK